MILDSRAGVCGARKIGLFHFPCLDAFWENKIIHVHICDIMRRIYKMLIANTFIYKHTSDSHGKVNEGKDRCHSQ